MSEPLSICTYTAAAPCQRNDTGPLGEVQNILKDKHRDIVVVAQSKIASAPPPPEL